MDQEVMLFLDTFLRECPDYQTSVIALWKHFLELDLPNGNFVSELTSGKQERFCQRLWEMQLARHLNTQGHLLSSPEHGPDFRFVHGGKIYWIEAISPEPRGLPADWMGLPEPNTWRAGTVPHVEIALRWTAAFKEKWDKLNDYRRKGIVSEEDAYVIAIHGGQLGAMPLDHGISQYPLAVEIVFPIGPLAIPVDSKTGKIGKSVISERFSIRNANGASVPTTPFIDQNYAGVSAVLGYSKGRCSNPSLSAYVVHNPFANVAVPFGILGRDAEEWHAVPVGTAGLELELRKSVTTPVV
jgi:type I restriction enzyme S subunit